jgi:hypothetical protein
VFPRFWEKSILLWELICTNCVLGKNIERCFKKDRAITGSLYERCFKKDRAITGSLYERKPDHFTLDDLKKDRSMLFSGHCRPVEGQRQQDRTCREA